MDFSARYGDTAISVAAAAASGCRRRLLKAIRSGCSLDAPDNRGWVALHDAAAVGSAACVREIIAATGAGARRPNQAYVNSLTHEGESACYLAAKGGHVRAVRHLLRAKADIDQMTNDLSCPLYAAVDGGHEEVVQLLISKGAQVNRVHTASCWTCLHQAVYKGHSAIVRLLVDVCQLEALDDHKITPLFLAAQYGKLECMEILVNARANVNVQVVDLATPLLIASQEGHAAVVDLLLDHGADPDLPCCKEWPQLPIHAAADFGHLGILQRLVGVTDRACDRGKDMVSPLYTAIQGLQSQCVELLLRQGYSPDAQDCTDRLGHTSPLCLAMANACDEPCREAARLLVEAGASLTEDSWLYAFAPDDTRLLEMILERRWIPPPEAVAEGRVPAPRDGMPALKRLELQGMLCVALDQPRCAARWLPVLLKAGLEPSLLVHSNMLEKADVQVVNYLLEFVNWSTLWMPLKRILVQRQARKDRELSPHFDHVPTLAHLCRLRIRSALGPDILMRTDVVRQLPVPTLLHGFLQFADELKSSLSPPPPSTHVNWIMEYHRLHRHRHVV